MEMTIDAKKVYLLCADQCKTFSAVAQEAQIGPNIRTRIAKGNAAVKSSTLGRLAKVLKVAPADLLKDDQ